MKQMFDKVFYKKEAEMVASLFSELIKSTVSPYEEMPAFEFLYSDLNASLNRISDKTVGLGKTPSEVLEEESGLLDLRESARYKRFRKLLIISSAPSICFGIRFPAKGVNRES